MKEQPRSDVARQDLKPLSLIPHPTKKTSGSITPVLKSAPLAQKNGATQNLKSTNALPDICSGGDMKRFNVSMIPSRLAFASRLLARQIKITVSGRVYAPGIYPRLLVGQMLWIFQTSMPPLWIRQGFSIVQWRN
jgi:hypothetical protein